jgi:hypothetical protein
LPQRYFPEASQREKTAETADAFALKISHNGTQNFHREFFEEFHFPDTAPSDDIAGSVGCTGNNGHTR